MLSSEMCHRGVDSLLDWIAEGQAQASIAMRSRAVSGLERSCGHAVRRFPSPIPISAATNMTESSSSSWTSPSAYASPALSISFSLICHVY